MAGLSARCLGLLLLTLTSVTLVPAQRIREDVVKSGRCSTGFNSQKDVCYLYDPALTDQPTALQACKRKGGTLAALDTAGTADFVEDGISGSFTGHFCAWIGYHKDNSQWYDGSVFDWTKWKTGEPNRHTERCVMVVNTDYRWKDFGCSMACTSICQLTEQYTQAYAKLEARTQGVAGMLPRSERRADSRVRCGQYCLQDPQCGKFNFHPTTLTCRLYDVGAVVDEAEGSQTFTL